MNSWEHPSRNGKPEQTFTNDRERDRYHFKSNRLHLRMKGIRCRIARPKIESRERLGRKRWVVERTIAWFHQFRRLLVRYERRADIHQAFLTLASCIILLRALNGQF